MNNFKFKFPNYKATILLYTSHFYPSSTLAWRQMTGAKAKHCPLQVECNISIYK